MTPGLVERAWGKRMVAMLKPSFRERWGHVTWGTGFTPTIKRALIDSEVLRAVCARGENTDMPSAKVIDSIVNALYKEFEV